jgi:calcium-dependent protein kinase
VYEIFESKRLGKGSYGSVYLCKHRKSGVNFACKVISISRISSHYLRKLHIEIAIMKQSDHPNIVRLREVFFGSRTVYMIMDLCNGGELFDHLTVHYKNGLPEQQASRLLCFMINSVHYLHDRNIVHRDLKLENFLFETKSPDSSLKLIDFGLSKHFSQDEIMHQLVGSAYYTAPEVIKGNYDFRCDTWSLGVIAYMLVSGSPPFYGSSSEQIHKSILNKDIAFPTKRFDHCSDACIDFLRLMLEKDADKRVLLKDISKHPFLDFGRCAPRSDGSHLRVEPSMDIVESLRSFVKLNSFKRMILSAVAFTLSSEQIEALREEFNAIDTDGNGTISMSELRDSMNLVYGKTYLKGPASGVQRTRPLSGVPLRRGSIDATVLEGTNSTDTLVADVMNDGDLDDQDDTRINYTEFIGAAMCRRINIDEDRLLMVFESLDRDGEGYLDEDTLVNAYGSEAHRPFINRIISEVDRNGDGKIDYKEFVLLWKEVEMEQRVRPIARFRQAVRRVSKSLRLFKNVRESISVKGSDAESLAEQLRTVMAASAESKVEENSPGSIRSPDKSGEK